MSKKETHVSVIAKAILNSPESFKKMSFVFRGEIIRGRSTSLRHIRWFIEDNCPQFVEDKGRIWIVVSVILFRVWNVLQKLEKKFGSFILIIYCLISYREVLGRVRTFADKLKTNMASATKWHWSCASKYCKSNWRTPEISYHRMTKVQRASKEVIE